MSLEVAVLQNCAPVAVFHVPATLRVLFQEHGLMRSSAKLDQSKRAENVPLLIEPWDTAFSLHHSQKERTE